MYGVLFALGEIDCRTKVQLYVLKKVSNYLKIRVKKENFLAIEG